MPKLKIVNIGSVAIDGKGVKRHLKNYANFYNELAATSDSLEVFAGYLTERETGFVFFNDKELSDRIIFTLAKGNSSSTGSLQFIVNYARLIPKLLLFCLTPADYFVFLPSPLGVLACMMLRLFGKASSIGVYVGGNWKEEAKFTAKRGWLRRIINRPGSYVLDKIITSSILHSAYCITPSYEEHAKFHEKVTVHLAPPLLNVCKKDLDRMPAHDTGDGKITITFCGELRPQKGCIDLLYAFQRLAGGVSGKQLALKFIGDGESLSFLKTYAAKFHLEESVLFAGHIKDTEALKEHLLGSFVMVLPSYSEGFPRVAYECFTLGVPTILSSVGGIPYLLKDGVHSLLVHPGDVEGIKDQILRIISDKDLRESLITNSRNIMRSEIFPRIEKYGSLAGLVTKLVKESNAARTQ